jgi:hypothetical protein
MSNFEKYRREYLDTAQARYEQAMAMAYRDLMLEYNDAQKARQVLQERLDAQRLSQNKLQMAMIKAGKSGLTVKEEIQALEGLAKLYGEVDKTKTDVGLANVKISTDIQDKIDKDYAISNSDAQAIADNIALVSFTGGEEALKTLLRPIVNLTEGYTLEQLSTLVATYAPLIVEKYNAHPLGEKINTDQVANLLSGGKVGSYISKDMIKQAKEEEYQEKLKDPVSGLQYVSTYLGLKDEQADKIAKILRESRIDFETSINNTIKKEYLGEEIPDEIIEVAEELEEPILPTPKAIRERAAEYYAPFASRGFQEQVGFRQPKEPKAKAITPPQPPEEEVIAAAIEELPPFANKLFASAAEAEALMGYDSMEKAAKHSGVGGEYAMQLSRAGDDIQTAISKIEQNENLDEDQKRSGYAMLQYKLLTDFENETKIPTLEEVMVERSRGGNKRTGRPGSRKRKRIDRREQRD